MTCNWYGLRPQIVSEKSLPQSTISHFQARQTPALYQKRACRNLQCDRVAGGGRADCIRKEPAAIYNEFGPMPVCAMIVSEKSLPQSTMRKRQREKLGLLYQKRACRNLQSDQGSGRIGGDCIRKEPAAIYNGSGSTTRHRPIVSEKSLPQSTIGTRNFNH